MSVHEYSAACRATKLRLRHIRREGIVNSLERLFEYLFYCLITLFLSDSLLEIHLQSELNECRCISTVLPMAITHSKQVESRHILHVWRKYETVLIYFVWIVRLEPNSSGESKLLDHILRLDDFPLDLLIADDKLWE